MANEPIVQNQVVASVDLKQLIHTARGQQVILDRDLARLYGVETSALNRAVKRNIERFPSDFMFQFSKEESLVCQIGISNVGRGGTRFLPFAFIEQGVAMLSGVLRSEAAAGNLSSIALVKEDQPISNQPINNDSYVRRFAA